MSHMQQSITDKQIGYLVETKDAGTCVVPADVCGLLAEIKVGETIDADDDSAAFAAAWRSLSDYCEGRRPTSIECVQGYFGRMSAPSYLDCTDWQFASSAADLESDLTEMYGDGE